MAFSITVVHLTNGLTGKRFILRKRATSLGHTKARTVLTMIFLDSLKTAGLIINHMMAGGAMIHCLS